jgi:hypothetical protein
MGGHGFALASFPCASQNRNRDHDQKSDRLQVGETVKLTANTVRTAALPAGKGEAILFDDDVPGFGLRLREGGSRSFVFQYRLGTKQRRMALGTASGLTVARARKTAEGLYHRGSGKTRQPIGSKRSARRRKPSGALPMNSSKRCRTATGRGRCGKSSGT